ncbi:hypothetical protein HPB52_009446 [Rhipicephalus sanguineus]|uniref:small monomeric GTPase n=1 Tax=Rhipicephalus sanguineus TaxID=34632 RepID=A0A9D4SPI7_RHISA|nr:hypothetical protein HPB52_009446 [Rhipicephalus sanguineus]
MTRKSSGLSPIRVMVMGSQSVGKSAVTVRFLTRRFISEYSSMKDLLYRHTVLVDNRALELEILDTSRYQENKFPEDKMGWADALVVVYSIEDRWSFEEASLCLQKVQQLCPCLPTILVANKRDLSHVRQVEVDDGRQLSLQLHCQFYEVSAADSYAGVSMAFQSILREVLATKILRAQTLQKTAVVSKSTSVKLDAHARLYEEWVAEHISAGPLFRWSPESNKEGTERESQLTYMR